MPVKRRSNKRREPMPLWMRPYLETGERPGPGDGVLECLLWDRPSPRDADIAPAEWLELRDEILEDWIDGHPGTRPWAWWRWDAQAEKGKRDDLWPVIRRRVGGSGSTTGDPRFEFGIQAYVDMWDPPQPEALPMFESEAAYLRRRKFLSRAEARRLAKKEFEPVVFDFDPEELAEMHEFLGSRSQHSSQHRSATSGVKEKR